MLIVFAVMPALLYANYKLIRAFATGDAYGRLICGFLIMVITAFAAIDGLIIYWWASCGGFSECVR